MKANLILIAMLVVQVEDEVVVLGDRMRDSVVVLSDSLAFFLFLHIFRLHYLPGRTLSRLVLNLSDGEFLSSQRGLQRVDVGVRPRIPHLARGLQKEKALRVLEISFLFLPLLGLGLLSLFVFGQVAFGDGGDLFRLHVLVQNSFR